MTGSSVVQGNHSKIESNFFQDLIAPLLPSTAKVDVLADNRAVTLTFRSREDANCFVKFCELYISESGAGNGYDAYWHFRDHQIKRAWLPSTSASLDPELINHMIGSITRARLAVESVAAEIYRPTFSVESGLVVFDFNPDLLPPRLTPAIGDLARVVDETQIDLYRSDLRVLGISGQVAEVCHQGTAGLSGERARVPLASLMKIYDYFGALGYHY